MARVRRPYPSPNEFREYVIKELLTRSRNAFAVDGGFVVEGKAIPTPTIMPFVRFTSGRKSDEPSNYIFFHLGLHGMPNEEIEDRFGGSIFEMSYGGEDVVGYAFDTALKRRRAVLSTESRITEDLIAARGFHPVPGITNISTKHRGPNMPIDVTVTWKCYNTTQLEFLRQHFLMAGGNVVIEYGHNYSNRPPVRTFNWNRPQSDILSDLADFAVEGRAFMSDNVFEPAEGNYDMYVLEVIDHSITYESDNTFTCVSKCLSIGEAIFGIDNNRLLGALNEKNPDLTKTVATFFRTNGRFDQMLNEDPIKDVVIKLKARNETEVREGTTIGGIEEETQEEIDSAVLEAFSATDGRFIPFSILMNDVINELFSVIIQEKAAPAAFLLTQFEGSAIGNHRLLSSIDPDTMVIVKPFMVGRETQKALEEAIAQGTVDVTHTFTDLPGVVPGSASPFFISGSGDRAEEKGLLNNGVWIAVDAVRRVFLGSNTFYASLINLLRQMSNATGNYWDLDIAYDEETATYRIYDKKCIFSENDYPEPYVFNRANEGELLDAKFDATFTKEARSAIFLSQVRRTRQEAADADGDPLDDEGALNIPSTFAQVLNRPDLVDVLGRTIAERRKARAEGASKAVKLAIVGVVGEVLRRLFGSGQPPGGPPKLTRGDENQGGGSRVTSEDVQRAAFTRREKIARRTDLARFQSRLGPYIALHSEMMEKIILDGRRNPNKINNYIAPIPTAIDMNITLQGITGLAFWDTFLIEKLPRIYREHGVFLINGISHEITADRGWLTNLSGLYYFVRPLGGGTPADEATGHQDKGRQKGEAPVTNLDGSTLTRREQRISKNPTGGIL